MALFGLIETTVSYLWIMLWGASLALFWTNKNVVSKNIENQARYFIYYTIISSISLLVWKGKYFIPDEYLANLITEIIGIAITVILIDSIYRYITSKNEDTYRRLSLKMCKMPIYTYCANWFYIYESDTKKLDVELSKYDSLSAFFKSDDFYERVVVFDFNKDIDVNKTYAQYYNEKMLDINDRFQNILAKYASKLSYNDIQLLEHFGGRAFMYTVFAVMKFISETKFSHTHGTGPAVTLKPFNNSFNDISKENFQKHFEKLVDLINQYNNAVNNDYEKWTIKNISKLHTVKSANENPAIEW